MNRPHTPDPAQELTAPMPQPPQDAPQGRPEAVADGRYMLGRLLGAGGMGVVRQARDGLLHRDVAVKLLADNLAADPGARERFLREGRAAARIVHPHVVAIYDVGTEDDRPYLVMELVDGPSLANVLQAGGPLSPDDVVEVAADALAGLARAHEVGLLHRDIKPGNLLRGSDRSVKVTDLGVAEAADVPGLTRTGTVVGTPAYLAPERRRGEPATVTSDLYALGVTLAELATGTPPAVGTPPELPPDTPPHLRRLIAALLDPDPLRRPPDAAEALAILTGERRTARPTVATSRRGGDATPSLPATADQGKRPARRLRRRLPVAVAAVMGLLVLSGGAIWANGMPGTDEPHQQQVDRVPGEPAETVRNLAEWLRDHEER